MPRLSRTVPGRFYQILSAVCAVGAVLLRDATTASVFMATCFVVGTLRDIERERRNAW